MQVAYFAGLVVNEAVNWSMKHIIKEFRPLRSMSDCFCIHWAS